MISHVEAVNITVGNLEQAKHFYTTVLPFQLEYEQAAHGEVVEGITGVFGAHIKFAQLRLGRERLRLTQFIAPPGGRPIPHDSRSNDLWFQHIAIVVSDMDAAYQQLAAAGVQHVSAIPQTLPDTIPAAAGIRAFYFRDADGHNLELIQYPADKGDPRWQDDNELFLGIDHTAIAVSDTARSLVFYRKVLGLSVMGESENFGTEQAHLNVVKNARLRITGLQTNQAGMGVEFLQYLMPGPGRPMPEDSQANDLWHWETIMMTDDLDAVHEIAQQLRLTFTEGSYPTVSEQHAAITLRDPDGHAVTIVQQ